MRFLLAFVLSFVSVFAIAQAPPMTVGGPQGIDVTRLLVRNWMTTPIYTDTPAAPLTGSGWPGRGYLITVIRNESPCPSCPPRDTSLWMYTGARWKRVGYDYLTRLVSGGTVSKVSGQNLRYLIQPYGAFFDGDYRVSLNTRTATLTPKALDNNSRIDVLVLNRDSFQVKTGIPTRIPQKPIVTGSEVEVASFYFKPFDSIPTVTTGQPFITNVFRVSGVDSIYYSVNTQIFSVKDSVGITKNDTAAMLNNYKFTAANGLTKDSTVFRLGGSLNQNTNINLNTRRLTIIGGNDTTRFYAGGQVSIAGVPDSNTVHHLINKKNSRLGNLEILSGTSAGVTGQGIRIDGIDQTFKFQGSGNAINAAFQFTQWGNDTAACGIYGIPKDNIRINLGFIRTNGVPLDTIRTNVLNIMPKYNIFYDSGHTVVRGIYYNPTIQTLNNTTHIAYQNTTGSNLLNSTSGNTRIGYNTNDTTFKLDVNGSARINGNGQKLIFTNDNGQVIIGATNGESAGSFGDVVIGFNSKSLGVNGGQAIGFQSTAKEKGVAIGTAGTYAKSGVAIGKYSTAESGEFVVGGAGPSNDPNPITNVYFGSGKVRARYDQSGDSLIFRPGGGDTCTINGSGGNGTNQNGGGIIIAGGKGTGTGIPGYIGFSTSTTTGSGTTLQTLTERARISPTGNLLINRTVDSIYRLDVDGQGRFNNHVNITNGGYLKITGNDKISLNNGGLTNFNTFITNEASMATISSAGGRNTIIGGADNHNGFSGEGNTIIGSLNNRINVTGNENVIVGHNNRNYDPTDVGNVSISSIIIGRGLYTASPYNLNRVTYFGFDNDALSGTMSNYLGFWSGPESRQDNSIVFGKSNSASTYNNVYFNGVKATGIGNGSSIVLNAAGGGDTSNRSGGNITIAGGIGTGNGAPGAVTFATSTRLTNAADSMVRQTLTERARISERGNLLVGTSTDDTSSLVNIVSTTKGFLQPRMTNTQRDAITTPATGLQLFSTTDSANYVYRGSGGGWQKIANEISGSATLDFPSTGHGTSSDIAFTVTGAELGDVVSIGIPNAAMSANISYTAWVSAVNQVTIRLDHYASSGNVDPVSATFKVKVFK